MSDPSPLLSPAEVDAIARRVEQATPGPCLSGTADCQCAECFRWKQETAVADTWSEIEEGLETAQGHYFDVRNYGEKRAGEWKAKGRAELKARFDETVTLFRHRVNALEWLLWGTMPEGSGPPSQESKSSQGATDLLDSPAPASPFAIIPRLLLERAALLEQVATIRAETIEECCRELCGRCSDTDSLCRGDTVEWYHRDIDDDTGSPYVVPCKASDLRIAMEAPYA